ncbi:MAG: tetratricopeptide repeat protein [bacterium]
MCPEEPDEDAMPHDVEDFDAEVIEASRKLPVVVDFWAEWCAPCRVLGPTLEKLAREADGRWRLAKVDTESFPEVASRYGVRGIPNVKLFVDGEVVNEFVGALSEAQVRTWLERSLPSPEDRRALETLGRAEDVLFEDPDQAVDLLRSVEPPPEAMARRETLVTLADLLRRLEDPGDLEQSAAGRRYLEALSALKDRNFDRALEGFIQAVREDRTLDEEGPRRACVAVFQYLGSDHPVVRERRGELAGALYT